MNKMEFLEMLRTDVERMLCDEYENATATVRNVVKSSGSYDGIGARLPESKVEPVVSVESAYEEYCAGRDYENIVAAVCEKLSQGFGSANNYLGLNLDNYEDVKDKLYIELINVERHQDLLNEVPHKVIGDFAIIYRVLIREDGNETASAVVRNLVMDAWGIDQETLHNDSMKNSPVIRPAARPTSVLDIITDFGDWLGDEEFDDDGLFDNGPVCLCTKDKVNGAGVIFYKGMMDNIVDKYGDVYILPSSVHEVLLVKKSDTDDVNGLAEMVYSINRTQVDYQEILSDRVYYYGKNEREVRLA